MGEKHVSRVEDHRRWGVGQRCSWDQTRRNVLSLSGSTKVIFVMMEDQRAAPCITVCPQRDMNTRPPRGAKEMILSTSSLMNQWAYQATWNLSVSEGLLTAPWVRGDLHEAWVTSYLPQHPSMGPWTVIPFKRMTSQKLLRQSSTIS